MGEDEKRYGAEVVSLGVLTEEGYFDVKDDVKSCRCHHDPERGLEQPALVGECGRLFRH